MKFIILVATFFLTPGFFFAQTADTNSPQSLRTTNYAIQYTGDQEIAQEIGAIMENYLQLYNAFFLKNLSQFADKPLKIQIFENLETFQNAVREKTGEQRNDFVYLHYSDPEDSALMVFQGAQNEVNQLGFQGFIQYLWNILPNTPAWLQEGFAYQFWDYEWVEGQLYPRGQFPFLTRAKSIMESGEFALETLLQTPEGDGSSEYSHLSWALVYFLTQSQKPAHIRLTGTISASLRENADLASNQNAVLNPIQNAGGIQALEDELKPFISSLESLGNLLTRGLDKMREGSYEQAREDFSKAGQISPASYLPTYYIGLSYYEEEDYANAKTYFGRLDESRTPKGLVSYVLALTAFNLGEYDEAKELAAKAKEEDPEKYTGMVDQLLAMISE